jgi:hypothetical protein
VALFYCGIRGAVTFYLALNMTYLKEEWVDNSVLNEYHKKLNSSTIICLIAFTVFFSGGTAKVVLDFLDTRYPEDKVYRDPEDLELSSDDEKSVDFEYGDFIDGNEEKSIGMMSRFEKFDEDVLQRFLRKKKTDIDVDPLGEKFLQEIDLDLPFDEKYSDFSPSYVIENHPKKRRESIFHQKTIPVKASKVHFSELIEKDKKEPNLFTPGSQRHTRRDTIQHDKMSADMLNRYSIIAAGKILFITIYSCKS